MKPWPLLLAAAALLAAGRADAGALYRWLDESGTVHLSDQPPPPGARLLSKSRIEPVTPPEPWAPAAATPPAAARPLEVVMYATATCPYCRRARQFFSSRGIAWREIDIESSDEADRDFQSKGGSGVPLIFINGTRIAGFDADHLDAVISRARRRAATAH